MGKQILVDHGWQYVENLYFGNGDTVVDKDDDQEENQQYPFSLNETNNLEEVWLVFQRATSKEEAVRRGITNIKLREVTYDETTNGQQLLEENGQYCGRIEEITRSSIVPTFSDGIEVTRS